MTKVKIPKLSLFGKETCIEVLFLTHKRNYTELDGRYGNLPKDRFLYYWETQIISSTNLLNNFSLLQIKEGKIGTFGRFLSYCNTPPKSQELAIATLKKIMICSYLAKIVGNDKVCELLQKENTESVCKHVEKQFHLRFTSTIVELKPEESNTMVLQS